MKKIVTFAVAAFASLAASAADYTVFSNGQLAPGLSVEGWWMPQMDFAAQAPDGTANTFKFNVNGGGADGSMGLLCKDANVIGPLHSAKLTFNWYAEGTGTYTIRLTAGIEENYSFTVDAANAGKWNETIIPVAETYPGVSAVWNDYAKTSCYVFSVIIAGGSADAAIYIKDVVYTDIDESWTAPEMPELIEPTNVPVPTHPAGDVVSVFGSSYEPACSFDIGWWGQSTQYEVVTIDGRQAAKLTSFNYLGWQLNPRLDITDYEYMHVDFFPSEKTDFGFTPISPGQEKPWIASDVKVGEWNSYDVPLTHWDNVNFADLFQIKFDQGKDAAQCYIGNVYFWKDTRVIPSLTLEATDITDHSAVIKYAVTLPEELAGADVKVFMGETDVTAANNAYTIEGLEPYTNYTYAFKAVATLNGTEYASDEVSVAFKTLRVEGSIVAKYFITNGLVANAYRPGEPVSARRELPVSMLGEMIYNADKTLTLNFTVSGMDKIVGMVPEVRIAGVWSSDISGSLNADGAYTYTTAATFEEGEKLVDTSYWMPYAGANANIAIDYTVGETSKPVSYGSPAEIVFTAVSTDVLAGTPAYFTAYVTDAEGNFLLNEDITFTVTDGDATVNGWSVTMADYGTATVEAACGELTATLVFNCINHSYPNVAAGIVGVASEYAINEPALATDNDENTQLEFSCTETQEHTFSLDLGKNYDIETIEVVWEGASATEYTLKVEADAPASVVARVKAEAKTYSVTDGEGGAGTTPRKQFVETTPVTGRYLTLTTAKAFEPNWGIKLKELRVMGTPSDTNSIVDIEANGNAPVRYFRIDGSEITGSKLPAGIYVKLQGTKATKVIIR